MNKLNQNGHAMLTFLYFGLSVGVQFLFVFYVKMIYDRLQEE